MMLVFQSVFLMSLLFDVAKGVILKTVQRYK